MNAGKYDRSNTMNEIKTSTVPINEENLVHRLLEVIENEIIPLTKEGVRKGNKVFGAALLRKSDLSTILAATNNESENPLWHGEIQAIKSYYDTVAVSDEFRVEPKDQIFLSTHEPCTMCASAIAWAGYDNFHYLFSHEESRDSFTIGHDLNILKEVFLHEPGGYARTNSYWTAHSIIDIANRCEPALSNKFANRIRHIRSVYAQMSEVYQTGKDQVQNIQLK